MSSQPAETGQAHAAGFSHTVRALSRGLSRLIDRYQPSETTVLLVTALLVGSLTGLLAVGLIELIHLAQTFFYHGVAGAWPGWGRAWVIVLPVLGGLIAGPILLRIIPEARGSGIPNVMEALILQNGRIRARVAPLKLLLTAITLGSGGSAGREGPVVHIGAAVGSTLANLLRLSANRTRNLVACGAARGHCRLVQCANRRRGVCHRRVGRRIGREYAGQCGAGRSGGVDCQPLAVARCRIVHPAGLPTRSSHADAVLCSTGRCHRIVGRGVYQGVLRHQRLF